MPRHLCIGANVDEGIVDFNGTKVVKVAFGVTFKRVPIVRFTFEDASSQPAYRHKVTTTHLWIKVGNSNYRGKLGWEAREAARGSFAE